MGYGTVIKQLLDERNKSSTDLARTTGIPRSTLYNIIVRDPTSIKPEIEERILWAFNMSRSKFEYLSKEEPLNATTRIPFTGHISDTEIGEMIDLKKIYDDFANKPVYKLEIKSRSLDALKKIASNKENQTLLLESFLAEMDSPEFQTYTMSRKEPILCSEFTYDKKEEFDEYISTLNNFEISTEE